MISELATNMVAIERIKEYVAKPQEAASKDEGIIPPKEWPSKGEIVLRNYTFRYRNGQNFALKGVNLVVQGGQKIGIHILSF